MTALPPRSNQADWTDYVECRDADTGEALDISDATAITVRLRDPQGRCTVLEASLGDGVTLSDQTGVLGFTFTAAQMQTLRAKTYDFGVLVTLDGAIEQVVLGTVPILQGL